MEKGFETINNIFKNNNKKKVLKMSLKIILKYLSMVI